jgi:hypothetical protein
LRSDGQEQSEAATAVPGLAPEISKILTYYRALIEAARGSLSGILAMVFIRRLLDEQTLAVRAAIDRHHAARDGQPNGREPPRATPPPFPKQQLG